MNIAIITPVYGLAGVPLAQIRFARALAARGYKVDLIVGSIQPGLSFYPPKEIATYILNKQKVRSMLLPLLLYFQKAKPDIVFSAEDHLTAIVLLALLLSRCSAKISGSSRILPSDRLAYSSRLFSKGWFLKQAMKILMKRATVLSCVSADMVDHYRKVFPAGRHQCIYNIIKDSNALERASEPVDHPWFKNASVPVVVSAGTFTKRKGFGDLLEAFALSKAKRNSRLIMLGDGYLRPELVDLTKRLGLTEYVSMPGNVDNALAYFSRAQVFVLSSYAEGLPNVLVEAMMCGCTPVSTDCPTGPREVLQDGKYGYLVPMKAPCRMADAIVSALDNPVCKELLDEAVSPFEEERVIRKHFLSLDLTYDPPYSNKLWEI